MDKTLKIKAEIREEKGSKSAAKIRRQNKIPAIVYGHKKQSIAITLDRHDFTEGTHHGHRLMDVQLGSKKEGVIVKDIQYDHLGKNIIHADLMRVSATERIKVNVPIELKGTAKGTHAGGIIEEHLDSLEIECLVTDIPEMILVHVNDIDIGQNLHAGDIELPEGVKLVTNTGAMVVACHLVAAAKSTEEMEEEEPSAPEIIGEAEDEDAEQEQNK